jgi:hypothetical protein
MALVQEHQFAVSANVAGVSLPGLWDKFEGGEVEADGAETYNAGGMADAEALPGVPKTGEVTLERGYRGERDAPLEKWLYGQINRPMTTGKAALAPNKSAVPGGLITHRGILTAVATPEHDSNGQKVTVLQLKMVVSGLPS